MVTDRLISINGLVDLISKIADKRLVKRHDLGKPQGVRGSNRDNTRLSKVLGWQPAISLEEGLSVTYKWISAELEKRFAYNVAMHTDLRAAKAISVPKANANSRFTSQ